MGAGIAARVDGWVRADEQGAVGQRLDGGGTHGGGEAAEESPPRAALLGQAAH